MQRLSNMRSGTPAVDERDGSDRLSVSLRDGEITPNRGRNCSQLVSYPLAVLVVGYNSLFLSAPHFRAELLEFCFDFHLTRMYLSSFIAVET